MTRFVPPFLAFVSLFPLLADAAYPLHPATTYVEGEVVVKYRAGLAATTLAKRGLGLTRLGAHFDGRIETLGLPAMTTVAQVLPMLRADPAIEYAEPDFRRVRYSAPHVPDDPYFPDQWGLNASHQANFESSDPALASQPGADMDLLEAWDPGHDGSFSGAGDGSATIAIIDDSVNIAHEDLAPNIVQGYDFKDHDTDPSPVAANGDFHGTMVAGCAGAVGNNGKGVAGVAWNVKLMPLRFDFDTGTFLAAMDFAKTHGANIVNASFGGPSFSQAELDGIRALAADDLTPGTGGILFVAAAGNDDSNTDVAQLSYPANYPADNIVSVAATNRQDDIASFSQYGPISVDVAAPGLQIVTTANTGYTTNPGVAGTSFASPYTAGVAALLKMKFPTATYGELKSRLIEGAEPGGNAGRRTAGGRIDAANSLNLAAQPSIVIDAASFDGNGVLDPGETTVLTLTLRNGWQPAGNVTATLTADHGLTSPDGAVSFGSIATGATVAREFHVMVPGGITSHQYVDFSLAISADGYATTRHFRAEIGKLFNSTTAVTQAFAPFTSDPYDDFHAWHIDLEALPPGHNQLVIQTTAPDDIDLLVKYGAPPRYDITVGINPEVDHGFFCTTSDGADSDCLDDDVYMSATAGGNEQVVIDDPAPGTYHLVIVNFAQRSAGMNYTVKAYTRAKPGSPPPASGGTGGGGGGGALGGSLLPLALAALARRRRTCR